MNAYDMVMAAAVAGVEPDDQDLAAVKAPPGVDEAGFRRTTAGIAREIAEFRRIGHNDEARKRAAEATAKYGEAFRSLLPEQVDERRESLSDIAQRMFS